VAVAEGAGTAGLNGATLILEMVALELLLILSGLRTTTCRWRWAAVEVLGLAVSAAQGLAAQGAAEPGAFCNITF